MMIEELKALPVGSLVRISYGDGTTEIGEVISTGNQEIRIMWPDSNLTQLIVPTKSWESFVKWLEVVDC